ncbi:MAG: SusC/RagA family TonB-linked outer membrane protein, partial [Bacteroidetes bacterium]|nr:SusC/RagA family TonB-linked outer membrane protein [Bacteroidota bacterium]
MKQFLYLLLLVTTSHLALAQKSVTGVVSDVYGEAIEGATVLEKGTANGVFTDREGRFAITVSSNTIIVRIAGFTPQELDVSSQNVFSVTLEPSQLEEVVVIGYGEKTRQSITSDISTVSSETIEQSQSMQSELALQGRIPGVLVTQPGGDPNSRVNIQIQGIGSFGDNQPLIVIDGIPITEFGSESQDAINPQAAGDLRGTQNVLNLINPNDIESISVLKDASAAAIYGFRAANGVILITTKRGSIGAPTVRFNISRGIQNLPRVYDVLNTEEYTSLYQEMFANNPNAPAPPAEFDPASPFYLGNSPTYDAQAAMLNQNAINESYHVNVSGGNESGNYAVNAGYTFIESPLIANNQVRYNFGVNSDYKINDWIRFGETVRIGYTDGYDNRSGDLLGYALQTPPWQPYEDPNQPLGYAQTALTRYNPAGAAWEFDTLADGRTGLLYGPETVANHLARSNPVLGGRKYDLYRTLGSAYLEMEPIKGLKFKAAYSADWYYNKRTTWSYPQLTLIYSITGNALAPEPDGMYGSFGERHSQNLNQVLDLTVNYDKTFGENKINFLAGYNEQQERYFLISGSASQAFTSNPLTDVFDTEADYEEAIATPRTYRPPLGYGGATAQNRDVSSLRYRNRFQGIFGRLSYSYADKIFVDASIRFDGSSKFAPGYRWGTFPAVSAAWRLSEESFMDNVGWVDELKLRAGWGQVGSNQVARPNEWRENISGNPTYTLGPGPGGDPTAGRGVFIPNFASTDLTWETENTTNVALSGKLFNRFVTFNVGYYNRLRTGVLQQVSLPFVVGTSTNPTLNTATTRNQGLQFEVAISPKVGDLRMNIS